MTINLKKELGAHCDKTVLAYTFPEEQEATQVKFHTYNCAFSTETSTP